MQLDDGWILEDDETSGTERCSQTLPTQSLEATATELDDGWNIEDVPKATVVRDPSRLVIYPRSRFTPDEARQSMSAARWRKQWEWATKSSSHQLPTA